MMARANASLPILLLFIIASVHFVYAQEVGNSQAHKFDEIQPRYIEDFQLRLYHFYDEGLKKESHSRAYIIGYNGKRTRLMNTMFSPESVKNWLIEAAGVPSQRVVTVEGGYRKVPTIEFWLVPEGASAPKVTPIFYPKKRRRHGTKHQRQHLTTHSTRLELAWPSS